MIRFIIVVIFVFFSPPLHARTWQEIEAGLAYKAIAFHQNESHLLGYTPVLHAFKIDPNKYEIKPIVAPDGGFLSAHEMREKTGSLITINANFFDEQGSPLGLIVRDGHELNPFRKIGWWGLFYLSPKNKPTIILSGQYDPRLPVKQAVEAGPRLLVNGRIPPLKANASRKSAICINKRDEVILVATGSVILPAELAQILVRSEKENGVGCLSALNLDGGSSTQMEAAIGSFHVKLESFVKVPVGLGVFKKPMAR